MKWYWRDDGWRKRFAWLPVSLRGDDPNERLTIWLEPYWARFEGEYVRIELADPATVEQK